MKKLLISLSSFIFLMILSAGIHVIYLYNHREFGPKDFYHPFILGLNETIHPGEDIKKQASEILKQPFTYLSHGGQSTVYESQDKKYVIKFFNPRTVIKENWFHQFA